MKLPPDKPHQIESFIDCDPRIKSTVLVAGTGRSGTTWIGDVVAAATHKRVLFEPFLVDHNDTLILARSGKHHIHPDIHNYSKYLRGDEPNIRQYDKDIERILVGNVKGGWVNQDVHLGVYFGRVVKEIRANLMIGYIARKWPELKVILVIRNPIDVVESMLQQAMLGWLFDWHPNAFLQQANLMHDYLGSVHDLLKEGHPISQRLAIRWCIENCVALDQISGLANVLVVQYEDLCRHPQAWVRISEHLGRDTWDNDKAQEMMSKPTHTSRPGKSAENTFLTPHEHSSIRSLAERFSLDAYCLRG